MLKIGVSPWEGLCLPHFKHIFFPFALSVLCTGTHWIGEIMHFILNDGRDDFDRSFMTTGLELTLSDHPSKLKSATPGYKLYEAMTSPRCIQGHCPEQYLPPQIFEKKAKVRS